MKTTDWFNDDYARWKRENCLHAQTVVMRFRKWDEHRRCLDCGAPLFGVTKQERK